MGNLKYGLYIPNFGESSYARTLAQLAADAENAGWDGFFLFDTIMYKRKLRAPMVDAFIALAAIAMNTKRIRIGTTVTPLSPSPAVEGGSRNGFDRSSLQWTVDSR